ncbi:hypothetical protein F2Q70_00042798 [Brassica cretica]|uniref:Uncharacterized protein n=1 Tax=Brassica cretica TaxID=69181 RepID=A0A8S9KL04_BRACR|nr:hypothetical protein F2Q70_00042798 [Brassica cretica]
MGRVTTPQRENPDGSSPVQQTGIPVQQTGVPMSQFAPPSYHQANVNISVGTPWRSGLFDCQEDQTNAVMTAILPCVTFGQIAEVLDEGEMTPKANEHGLIPPDPIDIRANAVYKRAN